MPKCLKFEKYYIILHRDFFIVLDLRLIFVGKSCRETTLISFSTCVFF